jgi:pimeloyl-ACP methyl ester carboxylesterase
MPEFAHASDGTKIAYEVFGEGPPVLLVHGFAASRIITWANTNWVSWLTRAGMRAIALDCRGHGQSGKPHAAAAYDDHIMAADVLAVLDGLDIPRADIIGYSMGGYLAMNLMHLTPARVGKTVIAGVGANYFSFWPDRNETIARGLLEPDPEAVTDQVAREFRTFATRAGNDLVALAACMRRNRLSLTREEIHRLPHPVLVVDGEQDKMAGRPEPLAELFPDGKAVVVPRRNHHSTVGDRHFKEAARAFLKGETVPGSAAPAR